MSAAVRIIPIRSTIAGRWQVPTLILSVAILGWGLMRIIADHKPLTIEDELDTAERLRAAGQIPRLNAWLTDQLRMEERPASDRAALHIELAKTIHFTESKLSRHTPSNVVAIVSNYQRAGQLGGQLSADDWVRLGETYQWSHANAEAADAYRQALKMGEADPDIVRRKLAELLLTSKSGRPAVHGDATGATAAGEAGQLIDDVLADADAGPDNLVWALERKVQSLIDAGQAEQALALVRGAASRVASSGAGAAVTYLEALCDARSGRRDKAEALLRQLRNERPIRDELWAKSGWLLGQVSQLDGRTKEGLAFYDEVLRSFDDGPIHDACLFGRAQSLAKLGRYSASLDLFEHLRDRLDEDPAAPYLDRKSVRAAAAAAAEELATSALQGSPSAHASGNDERDPREIAIEYWRLALDLTSRSEESQRAGFMMKIAGALQQVAKADDSKAGAARLFAEAGQVCNDLAAITDDADTSADWAWKAIECYQQAQRHDRAIKLLSDFVSVRTTSRLRPRAMRALGAAQQDAGRCDEALGPYRAVISEYDGLPDALLSIVPLAKCLLQMGGDDAIEGVKLLLRVVEPGERAEWVTPADPIYREALITLAQFYAGDNGPRIVSNQTELAVERLEEALALYPEDARAIELTFQLAEAYRRSARALRDDVQRTVNAMMPPTEAGPPKAGTGMSMDKPLTGPSGDQWHFRLSKAFDLYGRVIKTLAPHDESEETDAMALSDTESAFLRMSYLNRADCLYDLGQYEAAIEGYEEAAWRFDRTPAGVTAAMQIYNCYVRLGREGDARAVLGRLRWLLRMVPADAFSAEPGMPSREYWESLVERLDRMTAMN